MSELDPSLIGVEVTVFDANNKEIQKDGTVKYAEILVKITKIIDDSKLEVEHTVEKSCKIGNAELKFKFNELLLVDVNTNCGSRNAYSEQNSDRFSEAFDKAYAKFEQEVPLYFIFRHYRELTRLDFNNCVLVGITSNQKDIQEIIEEDEKNFVKTGVPYSDSPKRYIYSVTVGDSKYLPKIKTKE